MSFGGIQATTDGILSQHVKLYTRLQYISARYSSHKMESCEHLLNWRYIPAIPKLQTQIIVVDAESR